MAHRQATKTAHYLPLARPFPLAFAVSPLCISNCTANYIQQTVCQLVADEDGEEVEVARKVQGSQAEEKSHSHVFCLLSTSSDKCAASISPTSLASENVSAQHAVSSVQATVVNMQEEENRHDNASDDKIRLNEEKVPYRCGSCIIIQTLMVNCRD